MLDDGAGRLLWNGGGMKREEPADVRERIFTSCMAVIEREGIEALTVRAIAEEARMNVAAINDYFRSKDRLLEQVLRRTIEFGLDASRGPLSLHSLRA
ncbi:helix-turn-helix domain-containing protein [Sorangium sp. So ce136]|uniref:TetR family transcriptional regulator n=1 Tax=Sorangium sp. So ce136 TaxID=3133284 RepID=UPI003F0419AB